MTVVSTNTERARKHSVESLVGMAIALAATVVYLLYGFGARHWEGSLPGHLIGVLGILLMLWAGFAHIWRRRHPGADEESMRNAMHLHIIAGLVGPYLAILHGGLEFRGAAGMFTLATLTMVVSGLVGRAVLSEGPVDATLTGAALTRAERRRHMLGLWWWLHIPVSSALWVLAVWHIATWVFYQTRAT